MANELVPTGQPYGERKASVEKYRQAGVSTEAPQGPPASGGQAAGAVAATPPAPLPSPLAGGAEVGDDPLQALSPFVPFARQPSAAEQLQVIAESASNPLFKLAAVRLRDRR